MHRDPEITIILFAILVVGMAMTFSAGLTGPGSLGFVPVQKQAGPPPEPVYRPGLAVYFTDSTFENFRGGPETQLIAAIDAARVQVDIAAYDLDLWGMRDALIGAYRRGVDVRLVLEADNVDTPEVKALADAGIRIVSDRQEALMHNKFVVIDRRQVWTGSMNFTLNGAYRNDNHLIALDSREAAEVYKAEFEEMYTHGLFGALSPEGPGSPIRLGLPGDRGIEVEILFAPDDSPVERISALVNGAQESIHFMVFSFTSDELGQAMLERAGVGVEVRGVFDESQLKSSRGSEYEYLLAAGLDVRVDGSRYKLHHKAIIIDREIVITGSYNFSASAEKRNDENIVIIHDEAIGEVFYEEWVRIFESAH